MSVSEIRESTRKQVQALGYAFNPSLPLLDEIDFIKPADEVVGRILSLYACVACSYGFSKPKALDWLEQEGCIGCLADSEKKYLSGGSENQRRVIQWRVEALWSVTWAAGYHNELDFSDTCPDSFVDMFPDLKNATPSRSFAGRCNVRHADEIVSLLDLAYCLHSAVRNQNMGVVKAKEKVPSQVIEERRRGLEWLVTDEDWDNISLDT